MPRQSGNARLVDGQPDGQVPAGDRGVLFGDGLFETMAFHHGQCRLWPLHMARLEHGCRVLGLPLQERALLADECRRVAAGEPHCVVRLTLTRGSGGAGYFPPSAPEVTRIVQRRPFPAGIERLRREGLRMATSSIRLPAIDKLAGLKHLNRLAQVMIARECAQRGADEALVLDPDGVIVEGLHGNVVVERDGGLVAPGPHPAAVAGVGLEWLRRSAGDALRERAMKASELMPGDSVWVLNSVRGLCPVAVLDKRPLNVGRAGGEWQARWFEEIEK
ncbi:MAG: aminodeoxychorismate lyase [Wenzhouxiangellaceae bacterium]|nr:aminodeoxychorismate lyase [Wenzhouxiangellaceae bacterium]